MTTSSSSTRRGFVSAAAATFVGASAARAQNLRGDEALSKILIDGEGWQQVADGFGFADGACSDPDGNFVFSDTPKGKVYRVAATEKPARPTLFWGDAPKITGQKFGPDGRLFVAAHGQTGQILSYTPAKKSATVLAPDVSPNDLVVTRKGDVYFTDSNAGQVVLIDAAGQRRTVIGGLLKPNGLSLSPDEGTLAVSEYGGKHVWAYRVESNGGLGQGSPWMVLRTPFGREDSGGDGMATDPEGRFYVCSHLGIQMFDWTGRMGGIIAPPSPRPTVNIAFAGPGRSYIYACAVDKVFRRKLKLTAPK